MSNISIANVVNVSVAAQLSGLNVFNTSNLALFTSEVPGNTFGAGAYATYLDPTQVGVDFGTTSVTYKMALSVFSQQPNILTGGGQLVIIPLHHDLPAVTAVQHLAFTSDPTTGTFKLNNPLHPLESTGSLAADSDDAAIQAAIQAQWTGCGSVTVVGQVDQYLNIGYDVTFTGVSGPVPLITVTQDSLQDTDGEDVFISSATTTIGVAAGSAETMGAAITRTKDSVQYFGCMENDILSDQGQVAMLADATVVQALNKLAFFVSDDAADVEPAGLLDQLRTGSFTHSRGLLYINGQDGLTQLQMMAAYAGSGLSTDFTGSLTTSTRHLKQLSGIQPDADMTQTILKKSETAGADTYISIEGRPSVFTSGTNRFFDSIYNQCWLVAALQVAQFNYAAQTATKIPQTEPAMDGLKGTIRKVLEQGVINGYIAPGEWNSATTFGDQTKLIANVLQTGYYIYSLPINQQAQADREARKLPLCQVALKEAGAGHSLSTVVNINL